MDAHNDSLIKVLEELVGLYGNLFDLLLKEKSYLINAQLELLIECNKTKEAILYKIKKVDQLRELEAQKIAHNLGLTVQPFRLLELANHLKMKNQPQLAELFIQIHKTLTLQIERVKELNQENEVYAQSALKTLNGAIDDIKQTVVGKKVYGKKGKMSGTSEVQSGNFVSKEA